MDAFLAQVLQRRCNHETFDVRYVDRERGGWLFERLRVEGVPTLAVVENRRVQARLDEINGCADLRRFLAPWLR